jgi:hypothetical protein
MSLSFTIAAVFASSVIFVSVSRGTHGHLLLSQIWDSPNLEDQVPIFISPRNRVARLYPQALGSLGLTANWRIYHESPLCKLDTDRIENTSSGVLLKGMFIAQFPSNKLPAFAATRMFAESLLSNDDIPLLLRVWTCLPSYCLATVWSNSLR